MENASGLNLLPDVLLQQVALGVRVQWRGGWRRERGLGGAKRRRPNLIALEYGSFPICTLAGWSPPPDPQNCSMVMLSAVAMGKACENQGEGDGVDEGKVVTSFSVWENPTVSWQLFLPSPGARKGSSGWMPTLFCL